MFYEVIIEDTWLLLDETKHVILYSNIIEIHVNLDFRMSKYQRGVYNFFQRKRFVLFKNYQQITPSNYPTC